MHGSAARAVEHLALDALALSTSERADLAHRLLLSLDDAHDENAEAFALRETLRRSEEIDRGAVALIPAAEALERLGARRPPR
jgi:hypothetical protein